MLQQFAQSFRGLFRRTSQTSPAARRQDFLNQFRKSQIEGLEDRALMAVDTIATLGVAVTENFDGMAATLALPTAWRVQGTATPAFATGNTAVTQQSSSGAPTTGGTYNFGTSASERAVGAMTSGSFTSPNSYMAKVRNNTGSTIDTLTVSYNAERYRVNTSAASISFFYSVDGTAWTAVAAGDIAASSFPTGASAYNFAPGLTINKTGISIPGLSIANNTDFFLRWNLNTTGASSQGIGIDDISITATGSGAAVNVGPTNTVPGAQSTNEDTALVFSTGNGNAISVSDPDAVGADLQLQLSVTNGTLTLSTLAGLLGSGNGSSTLQYTGSASSINAALQGLSYLPTLNTSISDTLTINTNDLGNTGTGGAAFDQDTVAITVVAQNDAPTILNNLGLTVAENAAATVITSARLQVSDVDTAAAALLYTVTALPTGGLLATNGTAIPVNGTFTQADIDAGLITYAHNGGELASDSFTFTVSDGAGGLIPATPFAITVTPVNDAPTIGLNLGLTVVEAATSVPITNAMLLVNDVDNSAGQLVYTLTTLPINGTLMLGVTPLNANDTFTQADINGGLLTYSHNGSETTSDSFHFTLVDGAGGSLPDTTFAITVTPANDNPVLALNAGLTVAEGAAATVISNTRLQVTDVDNSAGQIIYTLTAIPANGTLALNGVALAVNGTFTQADINGGLLSYAHNGSESVSDLFTFTVSDGAGGSIAATNFAIAVTPVNDAPLLATNLGLTVVEGAAAAIIASSRLSVSDADNTPLQLTYTLTAIPVNGTLALSGTPLALAGTFTQADINNGLLTYAHNSSETTTDSFSFTVSDGAGGSLPAATFAITVTPANDAPLLVTNSGLTNVPLNSSMVITNSNLLVTDVDNSATQLVYTVGTAPAGTLTLTGFGVLLSGDTFTQADVNTGKVSYTAPAAGVADSFTFTVSDGTASLAAATFNITLTAVNTPPTLAANTGLTVAEDATAFITNAQLQVTDAQQTAANLTYTLTATPTNGALRLNGTLLLANDTFTQADIDAGLLTYTHNGGETSSDAFSFTVSDGAGGTIPVTTFAITVSAVNDAPLVTNNLGLTVLEGAAATVITSTQLSIADVDNTPLQIEYTVTAVPLNGTLALNGVALLVNETFTQADINNGLLTYAHNGSETISDTFHFTVSDGGNGSIGDTTFSITVTPVNDAPVIVNNTGLTVAEGAVATIISSAQLSVSDVDNGPVELVYTVVAVPTQGTLSLNGTPLAVNDTFTPADISNNLLTYTHDGSETTSDSFGFTVSDGSGGVIPATLFAITVTPLNDAPTITANLGLTVLENAATAISNTQLQVSDVDSSEAQIVYTLTAVPTNGTLAVSGTPLVVNSTFTQADINGGLLTYAHNGSETTSDSFSFTVSDGAGGTIPATTFAITVTPVNDAPTITNNLGLTVAENAAATVITSAMLQVSDVDSTAAQLVYTVTNVPANGLLALNGTPLVVNQTFTQADINGGALTYAHLGSETLSDSFAFTVSDGAGGSIPTTLFAITITPVNDVPTITNLGLTVLEGSTATVISSTRLQVSDADNTATQLVFTVTAVPTNGTLLLNGTPLAVNSTFTQFDINGGALTYTHNGSETTSDSFSFTVSDGAGGSIPTTTFAITVTPVNDAPTLAPQGFTIAENSANGTSVGTVISGDVDAGDTKTFAITAGNANGAFAINPSTGEITVANSALLNFEATPTIPLTVRVTDSGNAQASNTVTITLTDVVEPVGITVTPTAGLTTTEAGGTATFTIVLTSQPTANVTVSLTSNNTAEGTVSPNSVTFTSLNWSVPQTVTVTGVDDAIDDGDIAYAIVTGAATSADSLYAGFNPSDVSVTNIDNDALTPPTISDIANQTTNEDTPLANIPFTVGDAETAVGSLLVTASSSDVTLFPPGSITLGGSGANRTISLSPAANLSGTATITVTVEDGDGSMTTDTFTVQVTAVNDAPTLNPIASIPALPNSPGLQTLSLTGITAGGGESQTLTVTATSSNPALVPNPSVTYTSPGSTGSLSFTPIAGQSGTATITVTVVDDGGTANGGVNTFVRTFTVTVSPPITTPGFVAVVPDPENPGKGLLVINGTNSLDLITVLPVGNRTLVMVPLSGVLQYFDNSSFDRVLINALGGHDRIILAPSLTKPATINGDAGNDIILSGDGSDVIRGGAGSDFVFGRAGNDFIYGEAGADYLYGEAGKDVLLGGLDNDWLSGGADGDILNGGEGLDTILGEGGDDLIISGNFSLANNMTELLAIQAIWTSSQPFSTRITSLANKINSTTVTSDGKFDWVYTGLGRDWAVDYALMDLLLDFNYSTTSGDKRN